MYLHVFTCILCCIYFSDRYLLAYVPRVILYYSGRLIYDINTSLTHEELSRIISNMTGKRPSL